MKDCLTFHGDGESSIGVCSRNVQRRARKDKMEDSSYIANSGSANVKIPHAVSWFSSYPSNEVYGGKSKFEKLSRPTLSSGTTMKVFKF